MFPALSLDSQRVGLAWIWRDRDLCFSMGYMMNPWSFRWSFNALEIIFDWFKLIHKCVLFPGVFRMYFNGYGVHQCMLKVSNESWSISLLVLIICSEPH